MDMKYEITSIISIGSMETLSLQHLYQSNVSYQYLCSGFYSVRGFCVLKLYRVDVDYGFVIQQSVFTIVLVLTFGMK